MSLFIGITFFMLLLYVLSMSPYVTKEHTKMKGQKLLVFSVGAIILIMVVYTVVIMIDILHFIRFDEWNLLETGVFALETTDPHAKLSILEVVISLVYLGISFYTMLILYQLAIGLSDTIKFDKVMIKRVKMISNLFVLKILAQLFFETVTTGLLSISIEQVFIYSLLVVLTRLFIQAGLLQEDSDLAI